MCARAENLKPVARRVAQETFGHLAAGRIAGAKY
jgi:hypothetical protein